MITALIIIIALTLLLKIRLKLQLEEMHKIAFFGLGRSGVSYDFISHRIVLQLFGKKVKELSTESETEKVEKVRKTTKISDKPKRVRPLADILKLIPKSSQAFYKYTISILKDIIVEELEGQVSGGFDSPDITGQLFGYYQAAYYAVPSVVGRVQYYPNWVEASFDANLKASVAIPLYKIMYRSIILFFSLPLRDILKITIGRKERSHDG